MCFRAAVICGLPSKPPNRHTHPCRRLLAPPVPFGIRNRLPPAVAGYMVSVVSGLTSADGVKLAVPDRAVSGRAVTLHDGHGLLFLGHLPASALPLLRASRHTSWSLLPRSQRESSARQTRHLMTWQHQRWKAMSAGVHGRLTASRMRRISARQVWHWLSSPFLHCSQKGVWLASARCAALAVQGRQPRGNAVTWLSSMRIRRSPRSTAVSAMRRAAHHRQCAPRTCSLVSVPTLGSGSAALPHTGARSVVSAMSSCLRQDGHAPGLLPQPRGSFMPKVHQPC